MTHFGNRLCRLTPVGFVAVAVAACASVGSTRRTPSAGDSLIAIARLDQAILEHTRHIVEQDAEQRLALGLRLDHMPTRYTNALRDESRYARRVQRALESIWYEALPEDDYLTLLAVHWDLGNQSEAPVYRALDFSTVIPGASPMPAIARALARHPIEEVADVDRYLYLLDNVALFMLETRHALREPAAAGIVIPRPVLDSVLAFLRQYRQPAERSPFALDAAALTRIDSLSRPKVVAAMSQRIDGDINPQIDSLVEYLDGAYRAWPAPGATQGQDTVSGAALGLSQYPGGRQYYQYLLGRTTTLDVPPKDLYTYGVREVERISGALAALRGKLGFSGSDSAFRAMLREDAQFVVQSPNDFEQRVQNALATIRDSVRTHFGIVVADTVVLVARASQILDGSRFVVLREGDAIDSRYRLEYAADRITRLPAYAIPALVASEIVPGRQALLSAIQRNDSMATIRQLMRFGGFVDGWSEHARGLVGELGLYGETHAAYGALMLDLEAAARMVTDLGLHYFGWSYPQAVRYLRVHSVDASAAGSDVLRIGVAEPARAVAAKVGNRELAGQRAWVRRELAAQFDDGALQREVFRVGVLPLPVLSQHLAWFVWKAKNKTAGDRGSGIGNRE